MKIALWVLNVLLAATSAWLLVSSDDVVVDPPPVIESGTGPKPGIIDDTSLAGLRLPLGPRIEDTPPEALPRVRGVLTGSEPGSGVAFLEDPRARTEFAVLKGETIGPWTVASVGVDGVLLRGSAGDRVLPVSDPEADLRKRAPPPLRK